MLLSDLTPEQQELINKNIKELPNLREEIDKLKAKGVEVFIKIFEDDSFVIVRGMSRRELNQLNKETASGEVDRAALMSHRFSLHPNLTSKTIEEVENMSAGLIEAIGVAIVEASGLLNQSFPPFKL